MGNQRRRLGNNKAPRPLTKIHGIKTTPSSHAALSLKITYTLVLNEIRSRNERFHDPHADLSFDIELFDEIAL